MLFKKKRILYCAMNYLNKLSEIIDIDYVNEFIKLVSKHQQLAKINNKYNRCSTYSIEYYLYHILLVLTQLQRWDSLRCVLNNKFKYHYKTIQDKHLEWSNLNYYEDAYRSLLITPDKNNFKYSKNLVFFIDATLIYNKHGREQVGYGQNPKKKETKLSAICDANKHVYSIIIAKTIQKTPIKKTLKNDAFLVEDNLKNLQETNIKFKKIILGGDKGYARTQDDKNMILTQYDTKLIYPHRKNQKQKTPPSSKRILKNRYVIENVFAKIKKFDRICMRKDHLESTYKGFIFLALILSFKK